MIRMDYINDTYTFESDDILRPYSKYLNSCLDDMEPVFSEYSLVCDKIDLELMMMESVSETTMMIYEDAKKSFLRIVGEKILELRDKFMEFVNKMIDKIKTFSFNHKSNEQKLQKLLKEHPEFKNDTLLAVKEGTLNLTNIKSFKELNDNFDEIIRLAKKGNVDPNSLKGKMDAAIEKHEKRLKKGAEVAGNANKIVTAAVGIATIGAVIALAKKNILDYGKAESKSCQEFYNEMIVHKEEKISEDIPISSSKTVRPIYKKASDADRKADEQNMKIQAKPKGNKIGPTSASQMYNRKTTMGDGKPGKYVVEPVYTKDNKGNVIKQAHSNGKPEYQKVKIGNLTKTSATTKSTTDVTYKYEIREGKYKGQDPDKMYAQIRLATRRYIQKGYAEAIRQNFRVITLLEDSMARFYDKYIVSDKKLKAFHDSMRAGNEEKHETTYKTTKTINFDWTDDNGVKHNRNKARHTEKTVPNKS